MIEVENLCKFYGSVAAIRDVSFHVEKGEILGFLGPNGAGKTTTMRILTGYFPATSGTARVAGFDVFNQLDEVRKRIGYLPENVPLYTDMSVDSYLDFAAQIKGISGRDRKQAVNKVVSDCGLETMRHRLIKKLSKGYRQRVGLAQALVNDPEVLILDEPTVGLDPKQIKEIRSLVKDLSGRRTVILSTHILPEVSMTCNRVVIIHQGRIIAADTLANLTQQNATNTEILATVRGDVDRVENIVRAIPGVRNVARDTDKSNVRSDQGQVLRVGLPTEPDLRGKVARAITDSGAELIDLRSREITLEDVFIRSISAENARESDSAEGMVISESSHVEVPRQ
ncbi:ABC transporter ATP-binding protein [bacterium]|nr:ABC transporter ATP-binding protein [bacterium]